MTSSGSFSGISKNLLIAISLCTFPAVQAATVTITPGSNIQQIVNSQPAGTTFVLTAGVYRMQQITPRNGDQYIGQAGAILNGAKLLTSFSKSGSNWVATGQTQQGQLNGQCDSTHPRCMYPEDLFINNVPMLHVSAVNQVGSGKWFFDYANDKVYIGDNPGGKTVEIGTSRSAFSGSAQNVTIKGLIIEKYAIPAQMGAIGDQYPGPGWIIQNNEVRLNHGAGIIVAAGANVSGNYVHHNGQLGMGGMGDNIVVDNNEIAYNNTMGYLSAWEAGGTKFAKTNYLKVTNNRSHDNAGTGLWTDIDNINTLYDGNTVNNNRDAGISHEISYAATIRNNVINNNGPATCSWLWGGAIQIQNSQNVEVYGNKIQIAATGCGNGIVIYQQYRGAGAYGPYNAINNYVHDNLIAHLGNVGANGGVTDMASPDIFASTSNNRFNTNTYQVLDGNGPRWAWSNSYQNWNGFRSLGEESTGLLANWTSGQTQTQQITAPVASFTASPTSGTAPLAVSFDASASTGASFYTWNFGDGSSTGNGVTITHTYAAGTYTASLTVANTQGATSTATKTITVAAPNQAPVVNAGPAQTVQLPNTLTLTATATDDGLPSNVLTYSWSKVSGPGTVSFSPANALSTTASFSVSGSYVVRFTASDSLLSSSSDVTVTVLAAPVAPTNLTGTAVSTTQINLAWQGAPGSSATIYVERCRGTCTWYEIAGTLPGTATSFASTGLMAGTTYWHRVRSLQNGVYSAYTNVVQTTTLTTDPAPPAPTGLTVSTVSQTQLNVNWANSATDADRVLVERCAGAGCSAFGQIAQLAGNATAYADSGLTAGTTYGYRARSCRTTTCSNYSNVGQGTTQAPTAPAAPSGLTGAATSQTQINLTWTDNSGTEDSMLLERCTGANCSNFGQIAQLAANTTAFSDGSLAAGTTYAYRVRACLSGLCSAYSNAVQLTTQNTLSSGAPAGSIVLYPGNNIQSAVNANPAGTTFYLTAGMYRQQSVVPKNNNIFIGQTGAIMSGAELLAPVREGSYWVVYNQTQHGQENGICLPSYPRCNKAEDLYFDNQPLLHVDSLSAVGPGKWFFDYGAAKIYMADDPTGHVVETSVNRAAFSGSSTGVTINNLIIEKYAIPAQMGAIGDQYPGDSWTVQNCELRWNHGVGLITSNYWNVTGNYSHHNGEMGMGGHGANVVIDSNEIAYNLTLGFDAAWEGGGTKWAQTNNLLVRNNNSHDNNGLGLWTDVDNINTIYDGNTVVNNNGGGISHEISYAAIMRNNILKGNGPSTCSWLWGGQIQIQNSQDVQVYSNTIVVSDKGCGNGVVIVQQYRGTGAYGPYVAQNNYIHNNSITHLGSVGASGIVEDYTTPDAFNNNNRFDYNNYHVLDSNQGRWAWSNSLRNWSGFRSYGQEANGSVDGTIIP